MEKTEILILLMASHVSYIFELRSSNMIVLKNNCKHSFYRTILYFVELKLQLKDGTNYVHPLSDTG